MKNIILIALVFFATGLLAQTPKKDTVKAYPKFVSSFGPLKTGKVLTIDFKKILTSELKVKDQKNKQYVILSFTLSWYKNVISDNTKTGKKVTIKEYNGTYVAGAKIPQAWIDEIKEFAQSKEEIQFETIMVQDVKTKVKYLAPKIIVTLL
jgi:hypothetical protein